MEADASRDQADRLAAIARRELVETSPYVSPTDLSQFRHETAAAAAQWAAQEHLRGVLILVESEGDALMPRFQFDELFALRSEVGEVTRRLRAASMDDWALWRWLCTHNPWIGRPPIDLLNTADGSTRLVQLADEFAQRK